MEYRRNFQPGGTFFFTVVTFRRRPIFAHVPAVRLLGDVMREVGKTWPFRTDAMVLLRDHLHAIWSLPPGDARYDRRWSAIKGKFTNRFLAAGGRDAVVSAGKRREGRRGVWQPRFHEYTIRDEADFAAHVEYAHYNPVKHGLVPCPKDWPWSTFHRYVARGEYPRDWGCARHGPLAFPTISEDLADGRMGSL